MVNADGSGTHRTLQEAIAAVPTHNTRPFRILLKPGTYQGQVIVPKEKRYVQWIGEDAEKTIVTCALNQNDAPAAGEKPVFNNAGTVILSGDFRAEKITFQNTSGDHGQAQALRVDGDRAVFAHCRLLGWQDTLLLNAGRQYFTQCYIEGRVDFIYGGATAVFDRCEIHSKNGGHITAASTPTENPYGFVFMHCTLTGDANPWIDPRATAADAGRKKVTPLADLGRPWRPFASVIYLNCEMGAHIRPEGWNNWSNSANEQTARFAEYNSTGPGANPEKRVKWSKLLTKEEVERISAPSVLAGNDQWNPTQ